MSAAPVQRLERLLTALDTLVAQEAMLLEAEAWAEAADVRLRLSAVAEAVAPLALDLNRNGLLPPALIEQMAAIIARQQAIIDSLQKNLVRVKAEQRMADTARARLNVLRPAYTGGARRGNAQAFAAQG
jgi:hypothetical protein